MVFVDFWNFQLPVNSLDSAFKIDWQRLGPEIARMALQTVDSEAMFSYQGMNVCGSYDPSSEKDQGLRRWAGNVLNQFAGVQVNMIPRQRRLKGITCPSCHEVMTQCQACKADLRGTEEKGVDTRIVTDMIKLAWADNYDVAVLLSSDRDFVPVVEFLSTRGVKTIHGAFPPHGSMLSQACWGNFRVSSLLEHYRRV